MNATQSLIHAALNPLLDTLAQVLSMIARVGIGSIGGGVATAPAILDASAGIPAFQHGGIVRKPTFSMLGESGPEAVVPLQHGKIPVETQGGGKPKVEVHVHGDVAPHPGFTRDNVIEVIVSDLARDGKVRRAIRQYR